MASEGLILDISAEFMKRLEKADKLIEKIAQTSGKSREKLKDLFDNSSDANKFISSLQKLQKEYTALGNSGAKGMSKTVNAAKKAAKEIKDIIDLFSKQKNSSFSQAMRFSSSAKTVAQDREAIKKLQTAIEHLKRGTKDYDTKLSSLNSAIARHKRNIDSATNASNKFKKTQQDALSVMKDFGNGIATAFSIQQIVNFAQKIVNVRKEFELQHKSLQIIIQDTHEANKLWQQTVDLALQSPFRVKDLIRDTKQLAAYRIETEKLHDTTRMLADVSAGLGVDMQRLILAYGQVRAAEYLRGTELRQFTEAGVPMVDELAQRFSKLEGRVVSTAEVFTRISKRMVMFSDVEAVLKKMTDEGGTFYKMQEQQSKTLHGMISNLYDAIDLMMNDIGKQNDELLKNVVTSARTIVDNWRMIASAINQVAIVIGGISLVAFTRGLFTMSGALFVTAENANILTFAGAKLNVALRTLRVALIKHPILFIAGAVVSGALAFYDHAKAVKAANEKYDELSSASMSAITKLNKYKDTVKENNKVLKDSSSSEKDISEARGENARILSELQTKYPENFKNILQNADGTVILTNAILEQNKALEQNIVLNELSKGSYLLEDAKKNYDDTSKALAVMESAVISVQAKMIELRQKAFTDFELGKIDQETYEAIISHANVVESKENIDEIIEAMKPLSRLLVDTGNSKYIEIYRKSFDEMLYSQGRFGVRLATLFQNVEKYIDYFSVKTKELSSDAEKNNWIDAQLKSIGFLNDKIRDFVREEVTKKIGIKFTTEIDESGKEYTEDDLVIEWKKKIWNSIKELEKINPTITQTIGINIKDVVLAGNANEIREKLSNSIQEYYHEQKEIAARKGDKTQIISSKEDIENAELMIGALKELMALLDIDAKKKDRDKEDKTDYFAKRTKMIRDMAKAYEDLNKTFDATTARKKVIRSYSEAFNDLFGSILDIEKIDITTPNGVISALEILRTQANLTKEQIRNLEKAIAEVSLDIDKEKQEDLAANMIQGIEDMFGKYEVSLELEKLDIPKDFAEQLFGLESVNLGNIRDEIQSEISSGKWGSDEIKKLEEFNRKVTELETKQQQERLKKYLQYTRDAIGGRAKLKLEELNKLSEIEKTFDYAAKSADLEDIEKVEDARQKAIFGVREETLKEIQKLEWEQFKSSDVFIDMFNDIENVSTQALENMIRMVNDYKDSWSNLPLDQMREITRLIEQMENAKKQIAAEYDPFAEGFLVSPNIEEKIDAENKLLMLEQHRKVLNEGIANDELKMQQYQQGSVELSIKEYGELKKHKGELENQLEITNKSIKNNKDIIKNYDLQIARIKKQSDAIGDVHSLAKDLYNAFKGLYEALGGDDDSPAAIFADMGMSMADTVVQTLQLQANVLATKASLDAASVSATSFSYALNTATGVIGWIVMGVQLLTQAISAVVKAHDNEIQKQIEIEQDNLDKLIKKYDDLENAIDKAYNVKQLEQYSAEAKHLADLMIKSYNEQIALEESLKNKDEDRIKDLHDAIADVEEDLAKTQEDLFSQVTAGILDSPRDAAEEFLDAWLESFREVGDGLDGLSESADEMIANLVKKQIALTVVSPYLERWKKQLSNYIDTDKGDLQLSVSEANEFAETIKKELPYLSDSLMNAFEPIANLINLYGEEGELGGLQKGIEGITETQAEVITAYLNSLRYYVAEQNSYLVDIANRVLGTSDTDNPMLAQLRIIASQTAAINDLLNSLVTSYPNGGRGFKVVL